MCVADNAVNDVTSEPFVTVAGPTWLLLADSLRELALIGAANAMLTFLCGLPSSSTARRTISFAMLCFLSTPERECVDR
jgi:hypothetical protein